MIPKVTSERSGPADIDLHEWTVAGALIEGPSGLLLVQNRRRNGSHDWTPPGGVVEVADGEAVLDGLTREVEEETGLRVTGWDGPVYEVTASAPGMGWRMRVEVYRATSTEGEVTIGGDPDGIVVDAAWVDPATCEMHLAAGHVWVREPLLSWLAAAEVAAEARESAGDPPHYRYHVTGTGLHDAVVERVD
jgi:8-oxo-dGTP pyrophosphatase MutT (NUDIX family)